MKKSKESMDPDFDIFEVDYSEEFDRIVAKRRAIRRVSVLIPAVAACLALTLFLWPDKPDAAIPVNLLVETPPEPVDTVSIPSHPESDVKTPTPSVKKRTPSRRVVQTPPARPSIIADAPTPKAPEIDYDEILAVEEELRLNMMRERLNAEIEERTKELSQTPDAYIL
jgi:hypothetical protein